MTKLFTKIEKFKLIGKCIKGATAVFGSSSILTEQRPWISITILAIGAIASEIVNAIEKKQNETNTPT